MCTFFVMGYVMFLPYHTSSNAVWRFMLWHVCTIMAIKLWICLCHRYSFMAISNPMQLNIDMYSPINHWWLNRFSQYWPLLRGFRRPPVYSSCKGPIMQRFNGFVVVNLSTLSKRQLHCWQFETLWRSLEDLIVMTWNTPHLQDITLHYQNRLK